jgi:peptide/nickel transport system substrate-binding protein
MTRFLQLVYVLPILILCACSERIRPRDTLVIGISGSLNLGNNNPVMIQRNANVWETLTELDSTLTPRPQLAESWQVSPDGRQWTFHLRKDIRFHDGSVLSAALVAANLRRFKDHPEFDYYSTFTHLRSVDPRNDLTLELRFDRPLVDLPFKLGHYFAGIFSPAALGPDGRLRAPTGSGPYRFAESRIGQCDRVQAFDDFHGGRPFFREIEFRIIPDPAVRVLSLLRGDLDLIAHHGGVPPNYLPMLQDQAEIVIGSQDVAITHYLLFNCARDPFSSQRNRDRFDRLLDRKGLVSMILRGAGSPAHDFLTPQARQWDRHRFPLSPDTVEPGWAIEAPLKMLLSQNDLGNWGYRYVADYLADYFSHLGIKLNIESLEAGAWQKMVKNGQYDITLYPLSMPTGTPELLIRRLAFSQGMRVRGIGNTTGFSNPKLDDWFNQAIGAPTAEGQQLLFNQILDLLSSEKPFIPLYHERYYFAYRRGLTGIRIDPFLKLDLSQVRWMEPRP